MVYCMKKPLILYAILWIAWALWQTTALPLLGPGTLTALTDSVLAKGLIWLLPTLLVLKPAIRFRGEFPWLPCVAILCAVTAFLHTLRLLNGLGGTHAVFDPMFLVFSVSAGAIEELTFRCGFYASTAEALGPRPAAAVDGAMFTLYHFPELLRGDWSGLLSLRALLIFGMGMVFCGMYRKWRSPALNVTVHSVWNLLSYLFCLAG